MFRGYLRQQQPALETLRDQQPVLAYPHLFRTNSKQGRKNGNLDLDSLQLLAGKRREARIAKGSRQGTPGHGLKQRLLRPDGADAAAQFSLPV